MTFGSSNASAQRSPSDGSWTLATLFGIPLRVRRSFLVVLAAVALMGAIQGCSASHDPTRDIVHAFGGAAVALVYLSAVFLAVILHEFGHALVAQRHGVEVVEIAVWPLGGVAMLRNMPEDASIEARVSLAGPMVNLGIALLLSIVARLAGLSELQPNTNALGWESILGFAIVSNLALGLFNLLPAFPMDGGKVLRAWLARRGNWLGATERAVKLGRWICWGLVIMAFVYGAPVLAIIALYLIFAGARELWFLRLRHATSGGGGGGGFAFGTGPIADMLRKMQEQGARGESGSPFGFDPRDAMGDQGESDPDPGGDGPIIDITPGSKPSPGFSEDDVRRLEEGRGRLRRPD